MNTYQQDGESHESPIVARYLAQDEEGVVVGS
jgi:hypothetical protein